MVLHASRRWISVALCLLVAGAVSLVARPAGASTIRYRTDAELVALSERVVHARVIRQRTARPAGRTGAIYTVTTLAVLEDLTGVPGDTVEVWELGGDFGDEQMVIGGRVMYDVGAEVLVCLDRGGFGLRSVAMGFSKFDIAPTLSADGTPDGALTRNMGDIALVGAPQQALLARERTLGEFRDLARLLRGDAVRNPSAELLVPEPGRWASYTLLTFSNGLGPRWTEADSGTAVNWYKNTSAPSPLLSGDAVSEIQTALAAWTNPTSATIVLNYAGTTNQSPADGPWSGIPSNSGVITFEDPNNEISGSTLAIGGGYASFGNGGTVNGTTFNKYVRGYVIFQNAADLGTSYRQSLNFSRVMEHEIGHTIGLGHSTDASSIMYPSCCGAATPTAPALGADDLAGLNFIYPASGGIVVCSFGIAPTSASIGSAGGPGSVTVNATAGCGWTAISGSSFISITGTPAGTGNGTLNYSVAANGTGSQRTGTISIAGQTFTVTQTTGSIAPVMSLDQTSLSFSAINTGGGFAVQPAARNLRLTQSGTPAVTWTASSNQPWLTVSPASGTGSSLGSTLTVSVAYHSSLPPSGIASGAITFTFPGASPSSATVPVTLSLTPGSAPPFGAVDSPADLITGVTGSIAISGWALDDVGVSRVRIVRDPVAGEGSALVPIGTAAFITGARPDVAAIFPTLPLNTRAGWGYLMLTNFLPNLGNGTFKIYAIADDGAGQSTVIGTRTITCTNSTGTLPFGAIDTPGQGDSISGTSYTNFGWVLAPGTRRADPPGGGTVNVLIDGVVAGQPSLWTSRPDLSGLFSVAQYSGVNNALAVFSFNPSSYALGLHTIAWIVTDNTGGSQGVGSRYFTVTSGVEDAGAQAADVSVSADSVDSTTLDRSAIEARRGYDLAAPFQSYGTDANGRATLHGEELDRFELQLGAPGWTGYLRAGDELQPLPIGSHLDPETGVFTWQPGVGFVNAYDLVFVSCSVAQGFSPASRVEGSPKGLRYDSTVGDTGPACTRREIRIVLNPKGSGWTGPQSALDLPEAHAVVDRPFVVAGWAIDADDDLGTGVGAVHVWAYPVADPASPQFVGVATYGGARPDVGAIFGERFTGSGYGLVVDGLAPGTYDLAVFAWSTVRQEFAPAKVVRVTVR